MMRTFIKNNKCFLLVVLLCVLYWAYLASSSVMSEHFDSANYKQLGETIYKQGFAEFLRNGPTREPLYPASIAISMSIADKLSVNYKTIQKIFQLFILLITQTLIYYLLQSINIRKSISCIVVAYFGVSPAMVNSALSLYSEIISYPFVMLIIIFSSLSWSAVKRGTRKDVLLGVVYLSASFLFAVFSKGIFLYVFPIFLMPFVALLKNKKDVTLKALLHILMSAFIFFGVVLSYMYLNKIYNGEFEFTNRYSSAFFGVAYKRTEKVTPRIYLAHLANIPGEGVCRMFFSEKECRYCHFYSSDYYRNTLLYKILKDVSDAEKNDKAMELAFSRIKEHPLKYASFTLIEFPKILFWESTKVGFVGYPKIVNDVYSSKILRYGLRGGMALITFISIGYLIICCVKNLIFQKDEDVLRYKLYIANFILLMFFAYTGLYSLFLILTRYAFPIASLYIIAIAIFLDYVVPRRG